MSPREPHIGRLRETALHAALKQRLARPGDRLEVPVDGFVADVLRPGLPGEPDLILEVQTQGFSALRRKLPRLLERYRVRLVHPIALEKRITRLDGAGKVVSRRKSPKRGALADLFWELVSLPDLLAHEAFTLQVVLTREEEIRAPGRRSRRRAWRVADRRLLEVVQSVEFQTPSDLLAFIPQSLPQPFTSRALAEALGVRVELGHKISYCLRRLGLLADAGRKGRARLYKLIADSTDAV